MSAGGRFGGGGSGFDNSGEGSANLSPDVTVIAGSASAESAAHATATVILPDHVVTVDEGQQIEVVLTAVVRFLDEGAPGLDSDQAAQIRGAVDTIQSVTRMPNPSRKVMGWALGQLQGVPVGFLTGLASTYFPQLLHAMHG